MPAITTPKPVASGPIESAWGIQVHDNILKDNIAIRGAFTASVSIVGTSETAATAVVTASPITVAGNEALWIEFLCAYVLTPSASSGGMNIWLYEDGVSIGRLASFVGPAGTTTPITFGGVYCGTRVAASPGTHTYQIRASVSTGTGSIAAGIGGLGNIRPGTLNIRYTS